MLVVVGSFKSSPGVTTLSLALAATWPAGERRPVLVEADPAGGVIGTWWRFFETPGLWTMAAELHRSAHWQAREHAMHIGLGVDVVAGQASDNTTSARIVADRAGNIPTTDVVIADVGRLDREGACAGFLAAADHVIIVTRPTEADLTLAYGRADGLAKDTGGRVWLATVGSSRYGSKEILAAVGAPLAGQVATDRWSAAVLSGRMWTPHWRRLRLARHAAGIGERLHAVGPIALQPQLHAQPGQVPA